MKRNESRLFVGALIGLFLLGFFMQSCSSTTSSPLSSNDGTPLVSASANNNGLVVPDFSISGLNNTDEVALDPTPPGGGKDTTVKGGGRDTSVKGGGPGQGGSGGPGKGGPRIRPLPLPCLNLDSVQMSQVRQFMADAAAASKAANEAYRQAMEPIRVQDSIAMAAYRAATADIQKQLREMQARFRAAAGDILKQVKDGTMTREDAKAALQALRIQFETDTKDLRSQLDKARTDLRAALSANDAARKAANDAFQAALKQIQNDLNTKIAGILNPDQLLLWNTYLAGGDPCKGKGPRK